MQGIQLRGSRLGLVRLGRRSRDPGRAVAVAMVLALSVSLAACKDDGAKQECMNMSGASDLVTQAAALRVDIYDGSVACTATAGATPLFSRQFAKGQPIEVSVAPGSRTIVLTAFSDAAATNPIGRACTTAVLGKGSSLCFDLTIEPLPDLPGTPPDLTISDGGVADLPDLAMPDAEPADLPTPDLPEGEVDLFTPDLEEQDLLQPADLLQIDLLPPADLKPQCTPGTVVADCGGVGFVCCNNLCLPNNTTSNCGTCGNVCGSQSTKSSMCIGGSCVLECNDNFANCDGNAANGCESNLNEDPNNCGSCARACSNTQTNALDCTAGVCNSTCQSGRQNCSQPASPTSDNGCECEGNACCNGGTCQGKHDNGTGQTWFNCTAAGSHSFEQALASCQAYAGNDPDNCKTTTSCDGENSDRAVCNFALNGDYGCCCWWYTADGDEIPLIGEVHCNGRNGGGMANSCLCKATSRVADWN